MSSSQERTIEGLYRLKSQSAQWHAMRAVAEVGILGELAKGQRTSQQLAEALGLNADAVSRLMKIVCRTELVEQYGDDFALTTVAQLMPASLFDFGSNHLQHLAKHLKTGKPIGDDAGWDTEMASREWTLTPAALTALQALDIGGSRKGLSVLDVHCGSAVFATAFSHRDAGIRATLIDEAAQLERAKKTVDSVEIQSRVQFVEIESGKNWWDAELPDPFEMVLAINEFHKLDSAKRKEWMSHSLGALKDEGELVIVDVFRGQEDGLERSEDYELELCLRTGGAICDATVIEAELKESGFRQVQFAWLTCEPFIYGLLLATK